MESIFEVRKDLGLTQKQFAELCRVSQTLVALAEQGKRKFGANKVREISDRTGIPCHALRPDLWDVPRTAA